jgi:hypothetical protein
MTKVNFGNSLHAKTFTRSLSLFLFVCMSVFLCLCLSVFVSLSNFLSLYLSTPPPLLSCALSVSLSVSFSLILSLSIFPIQKRLKEVSFHPISCVNSYLFCQSIVNSFSFSVSGRLLKSGNQNGLEMPNIYLNYI